MKILTILVLTHNRKNKLIKCLNSIYSIYRNHIKNDNIDVIVCDNSSEEYEALLDVINLYDNVTYLNLRRFSGNIGYSYQYSLNKIDTKYLLIVEDDDILTNKNFHLEIFNTLHLHTNIVSFSYSSIESNKIKSYMKFSENIELNIDNIPVLWNGDFKFDCCYYPVKEFRSALNLWLKSPVHMFDGSSDEAIYLLMVYFGAKPTHLNKCGLFITCGSLNESLNNLYMVIYSSRSYIKELKKICNLSQEWVDSYEKIQKNIINQMSTKPISYNDIFNNPKIKNLEYNIKQMINNKYKFAYIKTHIYNQMKSIFNG